MKKWIEMRKKQIFFGIFSTFMLFSFLVKAYNGYPMLSFFWADMSRVTSETKTIRPGPLKKEIWRQYLVGMVGS